MGMVLIEILVNNHSPSSSPMIITVIFTQTSFTPPCQHTPYIYTHSYLVQPTQFFNSSPRCYKQITTIHQQQSRPHTTNTQQRILGLGFQLNVEEDLEHTRLDLDSCVESLTLCTTTCKSAMARARMMIVDTVYKEKMKEKAEKGK
jgi:hypothetical protein